MQYTQSNSKGQVFFTAEVKPDNVLYCEWIGYINDIPNTQKACLLMVEIAQRYRCKIVLNDNRRQIGPWPAINEWLETTWKPALAKAGIKWFAHIHSENIFTQISANKVLLSQISCGIEFHNFDSEPSALAWALGRQQEVV
jgi:hypothetical protein